MPIAQQFTGNDNIHFIGFTGGKGRNHLLNEIASELAHEGKKVVITNVVKDILPPLGHIVFEKDQQKLLKKIERQIKEHSIIYAGQQLEDHFVVGVEPTMIKKLVDSKYVDYLFLILGDSKSISFLTPSEIKEICRYEWLQEVIYCFQFDMIDQVLSDQVLEELAKYLHKFPEFKTDKVISYKLLLRYFTDDQIGAINLFRQKWPTHLVFTDINNVLLENHCINFGRDLQSYHIQHIWQANLKDNIFKRISP